MTTAPPVASRVVSKRALMRCFLWMGLTSFGGVLPFARRALVEQRGWLSNDEFVELLSLGQILPGPNIVNLTIMLGRRYQGAAGALVAFSALMLAPFIIVLLLAALYVQFRQVAAVQRAIAATAAATAGLVVAMGITMLRKQPRRWRGLGVTALAFIASGPLHLPLLAVLAVVAPLGVALAWQERR